MTQAAAPQQQAILVDDPWRSCTCPQCGGSGYLDDVLQCPNCFGHGEVFQLDEVEVAE